MKTSNFLFKLDALISDTHLKPSLFLISSYLRKPFCNVFHQLPRFTRLSKYMFYQQTFFDSVKKNFSIILRVFLQAILTLSSSLYLYCSTDITFYKKSNLEKKLRSKINLSGKTNNDERTKMLSYVIYILLTYNSLNELRGAFFNTYYLPFQVVQIFGNEYQSQDLKPSLRKKKTQYTEIQQKIQ